MDAICHVAAFPIQQERIFGSNNISLTFHPHPFDSKESTHRTYYNAG